MHLPSNRDRSGDRHPLPSAREVIWTRLLCFHSLLEKGTESCPVPGLLTSLPTCTGFPDLPWGWSHALSPDQGESRPRTAFFWGSSSLRGRGSIWGHRLFFCMFFGVH